MINNIRKASDHVIGGADMNTVLASPKARISATIRSLLTSEVISLWKLDELPFETALDMIEAMDEGGWEPTLYWLGHFCFWESFRGEWDMTVGK